MHTLQNLEITRISNQQDGINIFTKYPGWHSEYNFFIRADGAIKGKTSLGAWVDLTTSTVKLIKEKFSTFLQNN